MTEVYLVQVDCGDYYCGCGGGHVLGVYTKRGNAEAAATADLGDGITRDGRVTPVTLDETRDLGSIADRPEAAWHDLRWWT